MRFGLGVAVCVVAFVLFSCGSSTTPRVGRGHAVASDGVVAVGEPVPSRPTEVTGRASTVELGVKDPARPALPSLLLALVHAVRREPRDICFGTYTRNQAPMNGDVGCQVAGKAPLALALGDSYIPRSVPLARFVAIYGQADRDVARLELLGPGSRQRSLPLSAHRLFLAAFSPSARGTVQLRAQLTDGTAFSHTFRLPVTKTESGPWPRTRRHGAVFDYEVGENITTESYRTVRRRFGSPLRTLPKPGNVRCVYYDVVGYTTGWVFCFRGEKMLSASGDQTPPPGAA
jgi:hypothetical protein